MRNNSAGPLAKLEQCSRWACLAVLAWLPVAIWGALHAKTDSARVHDWLPSSHATRTHYDDFLAKFGDDQFLIVSWNNATMEDPRLEAFVDELWSIAKGMDRNPFERVDTSKTIYERLRAAPLNLSDVEAKHRITGTLLGQDGTACVLICLTASGIEQASDTFASLEKAASRVGGLSDAELKVAGTLFEEFAVDAASHASLRWLAPPSMLAAILVSMIVLRSIRNGLLVLILAGIGQLTSIALLYYCGGQFSAVLIVLPTLIFMLGLSSAIHLVNYFRTVRTTHADFLGARALKMGLRPSLLASLTTAIGMLSLGLSHLWPVRQFGFYSASCLVCATTLLLATFPSVSNLLLAKPTVGEPSSKSNAERSYAGLVRWIIRNDFRLSLVSLILLIASSLGIFQLTASTKFEGMFTVESRAIRNLRWFEDHIGPLVSVEVVLRFSNSDGDLPQRVRWLATIQRSLEELPEVGCTISAASFLPPVPSSSGLRGSVTRSAYGAMLRVELPRLAEQGWVHGESGQLWRVTCKMSALGKSDYARVSQSVSQATDKTIAKYAGQPDAPQHVYTTGLSPVINETQVMLLRDLGTSFVMAFGLITPMMMLITRSITIGLLAMIPNVLPIALVFGGMGWLRIPIDIAGVLTASIALGIAVDDTLHFVSWHTASKRMGTNAQTAIQFSFHHCATAMMQTTLISCAAMLPFFLADFIPTRRFAILMVCMLCGAILGDLVFLPALLSVKDRWNTRRNSRQATP